MQDFRTRLKDTDKHSLAPAGEACALFSALVSAVFVFLTGFRGANGQRISLYALMAQGSFGAAAGAIVLTALPLLFALTLIRYVRFLRKKSVKDSLYFSYATFFAYLAGLMLTSACAAGDALRLNEASVAGVCLGFAGIAASAVLFLVAKGRTKNACETASRAVFGGAALAAALLCFALFALGPVPTGSGEFLPGFMPFFRLLEGMQGEEGFGQMYAAAQAYAGAAFFFLTAFAVCAVLLAERLAGGIAQRRRPAFLRALLTAACGIAAAALELALALRYAAYADVAVTFTVPLVAMLLCVLTALAVGADTLIARSLIKQTARANRGK